MQRYSARLTAALWWLLPLTALAVTVGWETDWGRALEKGPPPPEAIAPKPVVVSLLPDYSIAGGAPARTETVERTLFNPTRRPAPALPPEGTQARMQRGQFSLTGTTVAEGKSTAFLREATGKSRRVQAGDSINGIKVAEVKADRVKLTLGDETEELVLKVAGNSRPTAAPPPSAPGLGAMPQPVPGVAQAPLPQPQVAPDEAQTLAERRRAARAAQGSPDVPLAAAGGPTPPAGSAPVAPAAVTAPDSRWQEVYRRYQERQR